jgi:hypothetical protein
VPRYVEGDTLLNIQSTKLCTLGGAELVDGTLVSVTDGAELKLNAGC